MKNGRFTAGSIVIPMKWMRITLPTNFFSISTLYILAYLKILLWYSATARKYVHFPLH